MADDNHPSEAELEARIAATLQRVFPGSVGLTDQQTFRVQVGRNPMERRSRDYVEGRADILVQQHGKPLAILELKREGLSLTDHDQEQGWSYAALSGAPIVVITNGDETRIIQTHDKQALDVDSLEAAELTRRIQSVTTAAQAAVNGAISRLLGTDLSIDAIAALTRDELEDFTGDWTSRQRFVPEFLVPREATGQVRTLLRASKPRAIVVSGPPLCGKSSVLRELATSSAAEGWNVLYVDGALCSEGLFRRVANLLSAQFSWPASTDDARAWLRQVALTPGRPLVVCIDSLPEANPLLRAELDEILANGLGPAFRLVVAINEAETDPWLLTANRRDETRLGRHSTLVRLGHYSDDEFEVARQQLASLGGGLVHGARYAPELRAPWLMRAAVAPRLQDRPGNRTVVLPPVLGIETFRIANKRFAAMEELRHDFRVVATTYVRQTWMRRPPEEMLWSLYEFAVSRELLKESLDSSAIRDLVRAGLLQPQTSASGDRQFRIRVPALFAEEVATRLFELIARKLGNKTPLEAAKWLARTCSRIPFGDTIGAEVVDRCARQLGPRQCFALINALLQLPPIRQTIAGKGWITVLPEVGLLRIEFDEAGNVILHAGDKKVVVSDSPLNEEDRVAIADIDGWLILSQVRVFDLVLEDAEGNLLNVAAWLLMQIGACPVVLRRPSEVIDGFHEHSFEEIELSCHRNGIVEPVTWAIAELLHHAPPGMDRDEWVQDALDAASLPLLNRVTQALTHLADTEGTSEWATRQLDEVFRPALKAHPVFH